MTEEELIIDVRTREEYAREHIDKAININLHDFEFYIDFLKDKKAKVYCNTGTRAGIAKKILEKEKIDVEILKGDLYKDYKWIKRGIISAVNYLEVKPEKEEKFQENIKKLCQKTNEVKGFLGSKLLRSSGVSGIGSFIKSDLKETDFKPLKYIIITYWTDKESHEKSHELEFFKEIYDKLPEYSTRIPYEEFYNILK